MSRVGRMPIVVPKGVKIEVRDGVFVAEGPKGKVSQFLLAGYSVNVAEAEVTVGRSGDSGPERAKHGLLRALLANAVRGVSEGFTRSLEIIGVGYRAELKGTDVHFALGEGLLAAGQAKAALVELDRALLLGHSKREAVQAAREKALRAVGKKPKQR